MRLFKRKIDFEHIVKNVRRYPCWLCWRKYAKKYDGACSKIDHANWGDIYPCDIPIDITKDDEYE